MGGWGGLRFPAAHWFVIGRTVCGEQSLKSLSLVCVFCLWKPLIMAFCTLGSPPVANDDRTCNLSNNHFSPF